MANPEFKGYRTIGPLGKPGLTARVYEAESVADGARVAIKWLTVIPSNEQAEESFLRELQNTPEHANAVTHISHGRLDGRPYIVMELMGRTLREVLDDKGTLSIDQVVSISR